MKSRRKVRSGAEVCRGLLDIPEDVREKLLLQALVEFASDTCHELRSGRLAPEDPLPEAAFNHFLALERQFMGPLAPKTVTPPCSRTTESVLRLIRVRLHVIGGAPPHSAHQARFMAALARWPNPKGDTALLDAAARLVTP